MGQLENAWDRFHPLGALGGIGRNLCLVDQGEEIQAELGFREVAFFYQAETQHARVEVQGLSYVLDPQHGVVENKVFGCGIRLRGDTGKGVELIQAHGYSASRGWQQWPAKQSERHDTDLNRLRKRIAPRLEGAGRKN
ncbi:hypothetical protein D3C84_1006430 [compost metagenome]